MRRFLIDGTVFEQRLTGVAKATLGLYQGVSEIDDRLDITICHRLPLHGEIPAAIKTVQLPAINSRVWRAVTLPAFIQRSAYDVVHFPWNGGIPPNVPRRVFKVLTLHDVLPLMIPGYLRHPLRKIQYRTDVRNSLHLADLVITDSQFSRHKIVEYFRPRTEPVVVYPASPLRLEGTLPPASERGEGFFFYCGGYDKRKGIELLLETFIELWRGGDFQIPLWLAGAAEEYSPRLSSQLAEARKLGAIKELGYISDEKLIWCYGNAMGLIYPSQYEGFGLPPLEAMALGCPVITYSLTSLPEVCGQAALYIDPEQNESLKHLILKLAGDEELRKKLSQLGIRQAAKFSWTRAAQLFLQAIEER